MKAKEQFATSLDELLLMQKWIERRPNGSLRYPLAVKAHLAAIMEVAPWALHPKEIERFTNHNRQQQ